MNTLPRPSEVLVTKFLRDALTADALGVPKLEAMARAAGLLGEGQRITQAKLFRRAKISLGIRSIRDGFGAGGGWLWGLPPGSDVRAPILATGQERSAPTEPAIPREWVEGVARLEQHRPPPDIPPIFHTIWELNDILRPHATPLAQRHAYHGGFHQ